MKSPVDWLSALRVRPGRFGLAEVNRHSWCGCRKLDLASQPVASSLIQTFIVRSARIVGISRLNWVVFPAADFAYLICSQLGYRLCAAARAHEKFCCVFSTHCLFQ